MNASILIADDEPGFRDLLAFALEPLGHRLTLVSDGAEAVAQAATRQFDLVVLDHHMPNLNGLETLKQLRALLPQLKVVMVTGGAAEPDRLASAALAAGASCCLFKPVELPELLHAVEANLPNKGA